MCDIVTVVLLTYFVMAQVFGLPKKVSHTCSVFLDVDIKDCRQASEASFNCLFREFVHGKSSPIIPGIVSVL